MLCAPAFPARNTKKTKNKKQGNTYWKHQPEQNLLIKLGMLSLAPTMITLQFGKLVLLFCLVRRAGLWALGTNSEHDIGGPALARLVLWL